MTSASALLHLSAQVGALVLLAVMPSRLLVALLATDLSFTRFATHPGFGVSVEATDDRLFLGAAPR